MKDLAGKVAFVTGGASGIGLGIVRALAGAGMKVVVADIEQSALDAVDKELAGSNTPHLALQLDVTDRDAFESAAQTVESTFGSVHVLCNNAGVLSTPRPAHDSSYEDWDWVMSVNVGGVVNGLQTFVGRMRAHGEGGHIVNTASLAGHITPSNMAIYNASKFAVEGLTETLRTELETDNIGVSALCPGVVATNIVNAQRNRPSHLASPSDERDPRPPLDLNDDVTAGGMRIISPDVVGRMVLHGILENEAFIFTHPEFADGVRGRHDEIQASFGRWKDIAAGL